MATRTASPAEKLTATATEPATTEPATTEPATTEPATTVPHARTTGASAGTTVSDGASGVDEPAVSRGKTSIADGVVEKIAGMAAREVPGVYALGGGFARAFGAVRDRVPGGGGRANVARGVHAEVGKRQTAIDLDVVVEYGVAIQDVSGEIRENVIAALERMTGLEVVEVNVAVGDVHLPEDDDDETRVA
ncbi:Asp23/Gls24 family envelope stress response protein [Streptomyces hainanensis]|uniref:Asp23/Gls24 family envelope stress response protein n=1 Tax=Streptomyces hainanensis TaxID=402648 RepID=A0A4R4SIR3_9ACTN|nr:Asp23/Gls24 family envelope stress response protein [Streptomyces hainanensis]TDC63447.1 Asp23/Gls24 family envelope stress response protein [Streptomyces hainanensis]